MTKFEYVKHFNAHPHMLLAHKLLQELTEKGWLIPQYFNHDYESEAIIATRAQIPVGYISFVYQTWNRTYGINGAYVTPEFRKQGIHTTMFEKLVEHAKAREEKVINIISQVHVDNELSQYAVEQQGRKHTFNVYEYPIVDWMKSK